METQYISLNMTPTGVNPCFHISQYDVGRMLGFIVHSGGATVDLDTYTCTIEATRSDGTAITSAVATTDNIGTFEVTPTMSNKTDKYRCQLVIVDANSKRIASLPFDMDVTKAAMDENSEAIEEDASLYQQYTEAVQGAIAEANADIQAEENARIAVVNAEATARQNADATLQNNIDAEATARQTADNTLQGNINSEASTRAAADAVLQGQIDNFVQLPSGSTAADAELVNIRVKADGTSATTAGNAVREQIAELKNDLGENVSDLKSALTQGLLYKGYLKKDEDLNDYQETGIYEINLSNADYLSLSNAPSLDLTSSSIGLWLEVIHNTTNTDRGIILQRITGKYPDFSGKNAGISRYGNYTNNSFTWGNWTVEYYSMVGTDNVVAYASGGAIPFVMESESHIKYNAKAGELFSFIISRGGFEYTGLTNIIVQGYKNGSWVSNEYVLARPTNDDIGKVITFTIGHEIDEIVILSNKAPSASITYFYGTIRLQQPYLAQEIDALGHKIFRVGPTRRYTSLLDGVIAAEQYKNSIVYVDPGIYDAVQEFKDKYGSDYFTKTNYYGQENYRGIPICNGVHIIGCGKVTVTGGLLSTVNQSALNWWSIFNAGDETGGENGYGFTLENITIKVLNQYIRYAVHDEYGGLDYDYTNKYINCHFVIENGATNKRCIGGGLGKHGYIVIDNCTIDAPSYPANTRGINYHNNEDSGSLSEIYVKDCYFPDCTVGLTWYGETPATEKTIMYVNNCYLNHEPIKQAETSGSTIENVDIISWNNTISQ